jgi:hypothetical protein
VIVLPYALVSQLFEMGYTLNQEIVGVQELAEAGDGDVGAAATQAHALFVMLERADPIRTNYWAHRRAEFAVSSGRL